MIRGKIIGQDKSIDLLRRSVAGGRLAHALLFVGPPGVGKRLVARTLAMALFCERFTDADFEACGECHSCRMMLAGSHPDFLSVACPEGKSELPIELLVGSRENRGKEGLCHDLSLRPMAARHRVALIDDADRMSTESANALLKTFEEPPPYAVMILIVADSSGLLPTIRSRCQVVRFAPLEPQAIARLVTELEWAESPEDAQTAAKLAGGSLVVAQQLLNPDLRAVREMIIAGLSAPRFAAGTLAESVLKSLDNIGGETQRQRTNAKWVVRFLVDRFQSDLREWCSESSEHHVATLYDPIKAEQIGEAIDRCVNAEVQLDGNVSVPLCLEALFSDLGTILQTAPQA